MLKVNGVILFSEDPKKLVEFYKKVFGGDPGWEGGDFNGFGSEPNWLIIGPHDKVKGKNSSPERMMFNLETKDVKGEFARLKGAGAKVVKAPYAPGEEPDMLVATLEDPDGNYFQLVSPM